MAEKNEKIYSSIVDQLLDDREPKWKDLGLADAQKSGEEQLDRTHQYVDTEFEDDIAESASHHTPVWPSGRSASAKDLQNQRLAEARATHLDRMASKDQAYSGVGGTTANWHGHVATQHPEDYKSSVGDDDSLFAEVTESLESAAGTGKVEKKEVSDGAVQRYIHNLLNQGESPAKIAKKLEKLAEIELFNHQTATRYLQDNAGLLGMAYLEPNTYMDKNSPTYERGKQGSDSNDCVRQASQWKKAGIKPKAASVKQISACEGCQYFSKNGDQKNCGLYKLPVVASTKELSPIVNRLTPGVPVKSKRAALVQIANGNDGTKVSSMPKAVTASSGLSAPTLGSVENQAKRAARVAPISWDSSHVAKLHAAGHSLKAITTAAEKKFGTFPAAKALSSFVATLKPNVNGQIVVAKADAEFLKTRGVHGKQIVAGSKCASCTPHIEAAAKKQANLSPLSRVPQNYVETTPDMLRTARVKNNPVLDANVIEHYHKKGHSLEKIYKSAASKFGSAQASKAIKQFIASLKNKPIKIALSQIDCTFLKNKLAVHNPIVGASKCATCTFRTGMHCGLTGGTLLSFPGMDKMGNNKKTANVGEVDKIGSGVVPEDGRSILAEYDLTASSGRPGDTKMADIEMNEGGFGEVAMGSTPRMDV